MIHKYWNVRLHSSDEQIPEEAKSEDDASEEVRLAVRRREERVENKVLWIWRTLSAFEEKSATCISDMLLHVSNGAYFDGIMAAKKFIVHVDILFGAADDLDQLLSARTPKGVFLHSISISIIKTKANEFIQGLHILERQSSCARKSSRSSNCFPSLKAKV